MNTFARSLRDSSLNGRDGERSFTIGGEFELELPAWRSTATVPPQFWQSRLPGQIGLAGTGRAALSIILECLKREDPSLRAFLVPSYLCESVLAPFAAADLQIHFYPVEETLQISVQSLREAARRAEADGILFVNYFGLPVPDDTRQAFMELKESLWVIEDCAPGGLLEFGGQVIGSTGHFAFTSLRKYLPLPDGAVIWNHSGVELPQVNVEDAPQWVRLRVLGKLLRGEHRKMGPSSRIAPLIERCYLGLFEASERMLDANGGSRGPSKYLSLAEEYDLGGLAKQRQENFGELLDLFLARRDEIGFLRPLFVELPGFSAPLVFPFLCRDEGQRNGLRFFLASHRIYCPVHWALPRRVDGRAYPGSESLSRRILGLPVDPRYGAEEMRHCFENIVDFVRRGEP